MLSPGTIYLGRDIAARPLCHPSSATQGDQPSVSDIGARWPTSELPRRADQYPKRNPNPMRGSSRGDFLWAVPWSSPTIHSPAPAR
jgi:hypothetical protein